MIAAAVLTQITAKINGGMRMNNEQYRNDREFLIDLIFQIRKYAIKYEMEPDDTVRTVAENMLAMLQIATFNGGQ